MRKRILSILLTLCMVLCLIPTAVFAEGAPTGTPLTQALLGTWLEKEDPYNPNSGKIYKMPSGNYYLAEDIYLVGDDADPNSAWPLIISEGDVTLDLNGHVLDLKKQNICIYSNVSLTDSSPEAEHKFRVEDSGLWVLDETQGTKTVAGGVITGGTGVDGSGATGTLGGGVYVGDSAMFTMNDGSIVGCTADSGSVFVDGSATFTMNDGSIENCTANNGGGVYVGNLSTFNMNDGSIVGCTADIGGVYMGGLVTFNMKGGSIESCTADSGGGVFVDGSATFNMNDGSIENCTADSGGGVFVGNVSTFNMNDGSIVGCTADNGGGVYVGSGAQFEMKSGGEGKNPTIKYCIAVRAGGGVFVDGSATFTMNDGSIEDCKASGAANAVHADGNFTDNRTSKIDKSLVSGINGGHTGSETDPILIGSAEGLKDFRDKVNGGQTGLCAKLLCDIELNRGTFDKDGNWSEDGTPDQWTPIGTGSDPYTGTFDGGGHTIKGLYVNGEQIAGLFGEIGSSSGAAIRNVTVDGYVKGTSIAGGIVGMASNSATSIQNCVNRCYVVATNKVNNAGGIVGSFLAASISGCANTGAVSGNTKVGGIAGFATGGSISSCYNTGTVSGTTNVGGIAGYATGTTGGSGSISSCYNTGAVSGTTDVGGVAGYASASTVSNCYNTGTVKGTNQVGGVVGTLGTGADLNGCYNTGAVTVEGDFTVESEIAFSVGGIAGMCSNDNTISSCYNVGKVTYTGNCEQVNPGGIVGINAISTVTNCYYLTGTAEKAVGLEHISTTTERAEAKSKAEFADGTVLTLLQNGDANSPWTKCGYLSAAGMTLPLLDWQTTDAHTHDYQWKYNNTKHWRECDCGFIEQGSNAAHKEVKGICTDGIKCACGYEMHTATGGHSYPADWTAVRPGSTHEKACTNPGCGVTKTESCTGGTATCTEQATCEVCGEKYGSTDPNNHSYEWQNENGRYWQKCKLCGFETDKKLVPTITITGSDKVCRSQDYTFSFTLPEGATDAGCGYGFSLMGGDVSLTVENGVYNGVVKSEWYDENENSFVLTVYAKTADGFEFSAKKTVAIQNEHSGGTATCTEQATCEICGEKYGDLKLHSYSADWVTDETNHWHECTECGAKTDEAKHTDTDKDHKCDVCEKVLSECADTNKDHKCDLCGKVLSEHTGGTATCKDKAVCEVCGESYGELDPNNHANLKHIDAKAATKTSEGNIEYWYCEGCDKYFADKDGAKEITKADTVTAKLPEEKPTSPKTGDTSNLALWIALLFISGGAVTGITVVGKKKKQQGR